MIIHKLCFSKWEHHNILFYEKYNSVNFSEIVDTTQSKFGPILLELFEIAYEKYKNSRYLELVTVSDYMQLQIIT